ncbi:Glutamate receptor ionotropic, NMDA 3A [Eumeta japonica]|uniref:Glutamate receptor ionotropic, NMDA 3A n=1 Tax=Eumeta variegata TaxID=151549 RepID=A0A4C1TKP7_EUMVA|nr:Glutamate receptor ionotropic, NMDA 3A [Eumeta japonica]
MLAVCGSEATGHRGHQSDDKARNKLVNSISRTTLRIIKPVPRLRLLTVLNQFPDPKNHFKGTIKCVLIPYYREVRISAAAALAGGTERPERALTATFTLLNLVPDAEGGNMWRPVGQILGRSVQLHTIVWPGGRLVALGQSADARTIFRIVTALAPPFVMEGELDEDGQCLRGLPCHLPRTSDRDNLTLAFNDLEHDNEEPDDFFFPTSKPTLVSKMATHCCYGLAMDLLENIAQELEFDFHLYLVEDGFYGSRKHVKHYRRLQEYKSMEEVLSTRYYYRSQYRYSYASIDPTEDDNYEQSDEQDQDSEKWNGIMGDLVSGAAHMSFAALSVSSARAEVIDFSQPYFFSGVSLLAAPTQQSDIPLLAFLLPFSPELWIAIFTSLNVTAIAVAIYEWLSPFGLNPWGRQRSKNFSISSALWVMWGLLCGHLVAFKAPKSWPNKFLINVWGGFSVIFVASYTANIAALIAGLFFHNAVDDYQGRSNWLSLRVGTARSSVAEYYVQRTNPALAQHMRRYALQNVEEGIERLRVCPLAGYFGAARLRAGYSACLLWCRTQFLCGNSFRNGTLDLLIADTPILDYYRATDHGCKLQRVGDHSLAEDTYAIGMTKGFPLKCIAGVCEEAAYRALNDAFGRFAMLCKDVYIPYTNKKNEYGKSLESGVKCENKASVLCAQVVNRHLLHEQRTIFYCYCCYKIIIRWWLERIAPLKSYAETSVEGRAIAESRSIERGSEVGRFGGGGRDLRGRDISADLR